MSNTTSKGGKSFRKVDVDEFDDEMFKDDVNEEISYNGPTQADIQSMLMAKNNIGALQGLLKDPPLTSSKDTKENVSKLIVTVISSFRSNEINSAVSKLSVEEMDVLIMFLYKGMQNPTASNCSVILNWFEKTLAKAGKGSIIRAMTARRTVL